MDHLSIVPTTLAKLHPSHRVGDRNEALTRSKRSHGSHRLPLRTPDRMAEHSRPYMKGDSLRKIDWKVFARSDELIVRQHQETASVQVSIFVDLSSSMNWPSKQLVDLEYIEKSQLALRIAYHLAYHHSLFGDQVELCLSVASSKLAEKFYWKPEGTRSILGNFKELERSSFKLSLLKLGTKKTSSFKNQAYLNYWIGDLIHSAAYLSYLKQAKKGVLIHTLSSLELDPQWVASGVLYHSGQKTDKEYMGQTLKNKQSSYKNQINSWCSGIEENVKQMRGNYIQVSELTSLRSYFHFLAGI